MWLYLPVIAVIGKIPKISVFHPLFTGNIRKLREALSRRCAVYNEQLEMVEQMEDEGKIIVIRPLKPVMVDRIERDAETRRNLKKKDTTAQETCSKFK